jgi:hypothetical protein
MNVAGVKGNNGNHADLEEVREITDLLAFCGCRKGSQDHQTYHDLFVTSVGNETVGERPHR